MKPWAAHWISLNCDFVTERGFHICIITLKEPENLTVISLREETAKRRRHDAMRSSVHPRAGVIVLTGGKLTMGFFDFLKGPSGRPDCTGVPGGTYSGQQKYSAAEPRESRRLRRQPQHPHLCVLPERKQKPACGRDPQQDGLYERKEFGRHCRLQGKGGVLT